MWQAIVLIVIRASLKTIAFLFYFYIAAIITKFYQDSYTLKLNEFIRIEYESPFSILLKFDCHKEILEFNLGCNKDHLQRLHEFVRFRSNSYFIVKLLLYWLQTSSCTSSHLRYHSNQERRWQKTQKIQSYCPFNRISSSNNTSSTTSSSNTTLGLPWRRR